MIQLRDYQREGLNSIWSYFASGGKGHPVIAWPTGTGKSVVPAEFIRTTMLRWPNQRFLMITHVKELIEQNAEVMRHIWPNAPLGIYSAGLKQKQSSLPIVFGGIQSMIKHPSLFGHRDMIFVDEAHLVSQDDSSMYISFIKTMEMINPNIKVVGMSATPYRMGQGMITDEGLFTDIVHDITKLDNFNRLIAQGYLSPLVPKRTKTELDVSNVGMAKGDFIGSQLQAAVDKNDVTYNGLKEVVECGQNRRSWLIFASGIEHAEHIAEMLNSFGIDCAPVHSKRTSEFNDQAIKSFKANQLRAIVNFSKLTTGFNHPNIDLIADFRPTMSIPLHVQKLGRGTRPAEGKQNCIAEGSLVLTNFGLIPIEKITLEMKVWDGIEFVSHNGVIYQGYKEVINYAGLDATPDHLVWTKKGWERFQSCSERKIPIAVTGNGRTPIRKTENYFSRNKVSRKKTKASSLYINRMPNLFSQKLERIWKCQIWQSWLSSLWQQPCLATASEMVTTTLYSSKRSLLQSKQSSISRLWWPRNKIQFFKSNSNGYLDYAKFRFRQNSTYRQNKQQLALRSWKFKIFNSSRKYVKPKIIKKHVFDITNAGKYNRFTVNGLLVSNCLVLDFSRNVPRLGPINDPVIPKKKGTKEGDIPVKICDNCGTYNHLKVRFCTECGQEFQFQIKITPKSGNTEILRSDMPVVETFEVDKVIYVKRQKLGKPPYIQATYFCGMQGFNEFCFPEHSGYAKHKFSNWWKQRHETDPPTTVIDALKYVNELRTPKRIRVWCNRKWPEVLSAEF